jgi:hypothetical protein
MIVFNPPIDCCILGAIAVQLLQAIDASRRRLSQRPDYASGRFYVRFLSSVCIAAIVGYIYFENADAYDRIVYFHTGASAPLLIRSLSASMPLVVKPKE